MNILDSVWSWKVQALPVLGLLALFEGITALRRLHRFYYIPMYFTLVPLYEINEDLATYLGQDWLLLQGRELSTPDAEKLRRRIMLRAVVAMSLAAVVTPLIVGLVGALTVAPEIFTQFLIVLAVVRAWALMRAWIHFPDQYPATVRTRILLALVYASYLVVLLYLSHEAYAWARPFVQSGDLGGLISALADLLIKKVLINGLLMALLTGLLANTLADRELRENSVKQDE